MKKKVLLISVGAFIVVFVLIGMITREVLWNKTNSFKSSSEYIYASQLFNEILEDENFKGITVLGEERYLGKIENAKDARIKAEEIWLEVYCENSSKFKILKQRPYKVYYDVERKMYIVSGILHSKGIGGTALIFFDEETGKVLSICHTK